MTRFECPKDGVIVGIESTFSHTAQKIKFIQSITLLCSSSLGITTEGPFGAVGASSQSKTCPPHFHIGYLYGKVDQFFIDIDFECVKSGEPVDNTTGKKLAELDTEKDDIDGDRRAAENHDNFETLKNSVEFDDKCFATKGRRPVQFEVFVGTKYFSGIRLQYLKKPVAVNCKQTQIALDGNRTNPISIGYDVIGFTVGSSCSFSEQQVRLTVLQEKSYSTANSVSTNTGYFFLDSLIKGTNIGAYVPIVSFGSQVGLGRFNSYSSATEHITGNSDDVSNTTQKSQSATIQYQGPGAVVVAGYRRIYRIESDKTAILYHYTCEAGTTPPTSAEIAITGNVYGNVHFQDYHFPFGDTECTTKLRVCISRIKLDSSVYLPRLLETKLRTEVAKCLIGD